MIQEAKSYEQFFVTRDSNGDFTKIDDFKVSNLLINSVPEELKSSFRSVIRLHFKLKMEKDPEIDLHLWNKTDHKYTKITELKQFPDLVDEDAFIFKYKNKNGNVLQCTPINEWIAPVPLVTSNSSLYDNFNTPTESPIKKARTNKDL